MPAGELLVWFSMGRLVVVLGVAFIVAACSNSPSTGALRGDGGDTAAKMDAAAGRDGGPTPDGGAVRVDGSSGSDGSYSDDGAADGGAPLGCPARSPTPSFVAKAAATPDYSQRSAAFGGFVDGPNFCGPTAVSNSLMYLRDHGFPTLVDRSGDARRDQHDLIALLASPSYFDTSGTFNGTPPGDLLPGLARYLADRGVGYGALTYSGWLPEAFAVPPEYDSGISVVGLDQIKLGIEGSAVSWLMLAIGHYEAATDEHVITNGHYVTVVGHGSDGVLDDPSVVVVHDPWTDGEPDFVTRAIGLSHGTFRVDYPGLEALSFEARDRLQLIGDWHFSDPNLYVLGLVTLRMDGRCPGD